MHLVNHFTRYKLTHLQRARSSLAKLSECMDTAQRPQVTQLDQVVDLLLAPLGIGHDIMLLKQPDDELNIGKRKDVHRILRES